MPVDRRHRTRGSGYPLLSPSAVREAIRAAEARDVSPVARKPGGFGAWYVGTDGGRLERDSERRAYWMRRRDAFIARHMAQVRNRSERLWEPGENSSTQRRPTRRHLALMVWAYSPAGAGVED